MIWTICTTILTPDGLLHGAVDNGTASAIVHSVARPIGSR